MFSSSISRCLVLVLSLLSLMTGCFKSDEPTDSSSSSSGSSKKEKSKPAASAAPAAPFAIDSGSFLMINAGNEDNLSLKGTCTFEGDATLRFSQEVTPVATEEVVAQNQVSDGASPQDNPENTDPPASEGPAAPVFNTAEYTVSCVAGAWSIEFSENEFNSFEEGVMQLIVLRGESKVVAPFDFAKDLTAPTFAADTFNGNVIPVDSHSLSFVGTCSEPGVVSLSIAAGDDIEVPCKEDADGATTWKKVVRFNDFEDGSINVIMSFSDLAGNPVASVVNGAVVRDTVAPAMAFDAPAVVNAVNESGYKVAGDCEGSLVITAHLNNEPVVLAPTCSSDRFEIPLASLNEAEHILTVESTDAAGNVGSTEVTVIKDITAPTLAGLRTSARGSLDTGAKVVLLAKFSEEIKVTGGNPQIGLDVTAEDGAVTTVQAVYDADISSDNKLAFVYTVQHAHSGALSLAAVAINLAGGSITDHGANAFDPAHADNALELSLKASVNGISKILTGVTVNPVGSHKDGVTLVFTASFNPAISWTASDSDGNANDPPELLLKIKGVKSAKAIYSGGDVSAVSQLAFNYTVDITGNDDSVEVVAVKNLENVALLDSLVVAGLAIDNSAPKVVSVVGPERGAYFKDSQHIDLTVKFSEAVNVAPGSGSASITLSLAGDPDSIEVLAGYQRAGADASEAVFRYTASGGHNSPAVTAAGEIVLAGDAAISDAAGHEAVLTFGRHALRLRDVAIDNTAPAVVALAASEDGSAWSWNCEGEKSCEYRYRVVASATAPSDWPASASAWADVSEANAPEVSGEYHIYVQARDSAGNESALPLATDGPIQVDKNVPVMNSVVLAEVVNNSYGVGAHLDFNISFDGPVVVNKGSRNTYPIIGVYLDDSTVSQAVYHDGSGSDLLVFRYTVRDGHNALTPGIRLARSMVFPAGSSIADEAGNALADHALKSVDSDSLLATVRVDTTAPSDVTILVGTIADPQNSNVSFDEHWTWDDPCASNQHESCQFRYEINESERASSALRNMEYSSVQRAGISNRVPGTYYVHVQARDDSGNEGDVVTSLLINWTREDMVHPLYLSLSAPAGRYKAGAEVPITVTFNEDVKINSRTKLTISVSADDGTDSNTFAAVEVDAAFSGNSRDYATSHQFIYVVDASHTGSITVKRLKDHNIADPTENAYGYHYVANEAGDGIKEVPIDPLSDLDEALTEVIADNEAPVFNITRVDSAKPWGWDFPCADAADGCQYRYVTSVCPVPAAVDEQQVAPTPDEIAAAAFEAVSFSGEFSDNSSVRVGAGNHCLFVEARDAAGNMTGKAELTAIDIPALAVTAVALHSSTPDPVGVGGEIKFQVRFNKLVNVDENDPNTQGRIAVSGFTGADVDQDYAVYSSGTGESDLVYSYTVLEGDEGASIGSAAAISQVAITDEDLDEHGPELSINQVTHSLVIDGIHPTVASVVDTHGSAKTYKNAEIVTLLVTFSEDVTVPSNNSPNLNLNVGGAITHASYLSNAEDSDDRTYHYSYTVGNDHEGSLTPTDFAVNTTIIDAAGNTLGASSFSAVADVSIDGILPVVTVTTSRLTPQSNDTQIELSASGGCTTGDGDLTVVFDNGGGRKHSFSNVTCSNTGSWSKSKTVTHSDSNRFQDASPFVAISASQTDASGNTGSGTRDVAYTLPATSVSGVSGTGGIKKLGDALSFDVTFSHNVSGSAPQLRLALDGGAHQDMSCAVSGSSMNCTHTVGAADNLASSKPQLSIQGGALTGIWGKDIIANINSGNSGSLANLTVDGTVPVVTINSISNSSFTANNGSVSVSLSGNCTTGDGAVALTMDNPTGTSTPTNNATCNNNDTWTWAPSIPSDYRENANFITVAATQTDAARNSSASISRSSGSYTLPVSTVVDVLAPSGSKKLGDELSISVVFSSALTNLTSNVFLRLNLDSDYLILSCATAHDNNRKVECIKASIPTGTSHSAKKPVVAFVSSNNGALGSDRLLGIWGKQINLAIDNSSLSDLTIDTTKPELEGVVLASGAGTTYTNGNQLNLYFEFSEPVRATNPSGSTIAIDGFTTPSSGHTLSLAYAGSGNAYSNKVGPYRVTIPSDSGLNGSGFTLSAFSALTVQDAAGNSVTFALNDYDGSVDSFIIDTKPLALSAELLTDKAVYTAADGVDACCNEVQFKVNFNEAIDVANTDTVSLNFKPIGSTASPLSAAYLSHDANTNSITFSHLVTTGEKSFALNNSGESAFHTIAVNSPEDLRDATGNDFDTSANFLSSASAAWKVSAATPGVDTITATAKTYYQGENLTVVATFNESVTVTGTPQMSLQLSDGSTETLDYSTGSSGTDITFTITVPDSGSLISTGNTVTSMALNSGTIKSTADATKDAVLDFNVKSLNAVIWDESQARPATD